MRVAVQSSLQQVESALTQIPHPASDQVPSPRIMLIDDDPFVLRVMECMLSEVGYRNCASYERAADALAFMDDGGLAPDVILLDLNMPLMDGVEVVRHLAERGFEGELILLSGEDAQTLRATEALARAHSLRVIGAHVKPVPRERIAESLSKHSKLAVATPFRSRAVYSAQAVANAIHAGELVNYYQPKVETMTGAVVGVESLVRWSHPTDGLVFPDQFILIAESNGLIRDLTRQVVTIALAQAKKWHDAGLKINIAINVSMDDLASVDFADFMIAQARLAGVRPESVVLELTESQLTRNLVAVLDVLARLRLHRFRLSIDDFGTGNSSLAQLRDLPFDELKIDRSFTRNAWKDQRLRAIFQSSVDLARMLKLPSVAEGVEDADDLKCVQSTGCRLSQGYFIARPMAADALPGWIDLWNGRVQRESLFQDAQ